MTPEQRQKLHNYFDSEHGILLMNDDYTAISDIMKPKWKEVATDGLPQIDSDYLVCDELERNEVAHFDAENQWWMFSDADKCENFFVTHWREID
jgi:hypothetical protein